MLISDWFWEQVKMTELISSIEAAALGRLDGVENDARIDFVPRAECVHVAGFFG